MGQELQVPDWAKKGAAQAFANAGLSAQDDNLADGIGQGYGVIGYKGKVWSLRYRGQRHNIIRPDDGTPSAYIDVIILGQAKGKSKSFYKAYDPQTSDGDRPICASIDGITPDADVQEKQCDSCALCPRNVFKTNPANGRKGRECTDYKRLAVLILPTQTTPILGTPLLEPIFLRVPPASLTSLGVMGETMGNQGFHYSSYITRITFDPNKAHPEMVFRPLQGLTDQEAPVILDLCKDPTVGRITGGNIALASPKLVELNPPGASATGLTAPAAQTMQAGASPAGGGNPPPSTGTNVSSATPATISSGLGAAPPATTTGAAPGEMAETSTSATSETSTGLGGIASGGATPATTSAAATPSQVSVADTGEPEESDAALDAQIAAMIGAQAS
jgi:hypothetical protein